VRCRQPGLEGHDPPGRRRGVPDRAEVDLGQVEHGGDVRHVGLPDLGVGVVAVVRLVGQAEASLLQVLTADW
jgi:hypothetical protein